VDSEVCGSDLQPLLTHMLHVALPTVTDALAKGCYHPGKRGGKAQRRIEMKMNYNQGTHDAL
jgi:hypothetical protein